MMVFWASGSSGIDDISWSNAEFTRFKNSPRVSALCVYEFWFPTFSKAPFGDFLAGEMFLEITFNFLVKD